VTCIVGAVGADGRIYIGGDSSGTSGWTQTPRADQKVFERREYVFGFTTSFRMGQLLRYALTLPEAPVSRSADLDRFMATKFVDAVRKCLAAGGFAQKENGVENGGRFLVGLRGSLYAVGSDFQVGRSRFPFAATGCGEDEARGALYTLVGGQQFVAEPERVVLSALEASAALNAGVCGPFEVVSA
jgi:hypothetical protein